MVRTKDEDHIQETLDTLAKDSIEKKEALKWIIKNVENNNKTLNNVLNKADSTKTEVELLSFKFEVVNKEIKNIQTVIHGDGKNEPILVQVKQIQVKIDHLDEKVASLEFKAKESDVESIKFANNIESMSNLLEKMEKQEELKKSSSIKVFVAVLTAITSAVGTLLFWAFENLTFVK